MLQKIYWRDSGILLSNLRLVLMEAFNPGTRILWQPLQNVRFIVGSLGVGVSMLQSDAGRTHSFTIVFCPTVFIDWTWLRERSPALAILRVPRLLDMAGVAEVEGSPYVALSVEADNPSR